jgi:RimJ/RimL family protein N-acetyltransferase
LEEIVELNFNLVLKSDRILLRPLKRSDLEKFIGLTNNKDMWKYFTSDLSNEHELKKWVEQAVEDMNNKTRLTFSIIDQKNDSIIGTTSFGNISHKDKRIEIGWTWISRDYQGKGVNDQVKLMMLRYCFEELKIERVEFKTDVLNTYARDALLRIGAKEEGVLRSHTLMTNNRRRDTIFYSILKHEWEEIKIK